MDSKKCCDAAVGKVERYDKLGLTHEYLSEEYIFKNRSLQFLADEKNVKIGVIRNALTTHNIVKSAAAITKNRAEAARKSAKDPNRKRASLEDSRRAQRLGTEARNANRTKELAKQGITHEYLYNLYIEENKSLKELMIILDRPKSTVRKLLKRFNITKTQELRDKLQKERFTELYEDTERAKEMSARTQATIAERYGNKWYRVNSSSQEKIIHSALVEAFPNLEIKSGDYSVIKNPSTNAAMQLDIHVPELKFAVEFNGEYWHDRKGFEEDLRNGTCETREMLKKTLCEDKGITLIHIWDSDFKNDAEEIISDLIKQLSARLPFSFSRTH